MADAVEDKEQAALRRVCLELAVHMSGPVPMELPSTFVIERAQQFYDFVLKGEPTSRGPSRLKRVA